MRCWRTISSVRREREDDTRIGNLGLRSVVPPLLGCRPRASVTYTLTICVYSILCSLFLTQPKCCCSRRLRERNQPRIASGVTAWQQSVLLHASLAFSIGPYIAISFYTSVPCRLIFKFPIGEALRENSFLFAAACLGPVRPILNKERSSRVYDKTRGPQLVH